MSNPPSSVVSMDRCSANCENKAGFDGYCLAHRLRIQRTGDARPDVPLRVKRPRGTGRGNCTIEGCDTPVGPKSGAGLCTKHYTRKRVSGTFEANRKLSGPPEVRFFGYVEQGEGECWLWTGHLTRDGYGRFGLGRGGVPAHRWIYEYTVADIPEGLEIDHLCRVRNCVNPYHLDAVTHQENNLRRDEARRNQAA